MERDGLFIDDLLQTLSGRAAPAAESPEVTTQALGEEGDQPEDGVATTDALGEEGDQPDDIEVTSQALGEEGDQPDDQPIEYEWESSYTDDVPFDEPTDSDDDDYDAFDTAL
jgi:hypothetical protein